MRTAKVRQAREGSPKIRRPADFSGRAGPSVVPARVEVVLDGHHQRSQRGAASGSRTVKR
ncbi:MAG: hypothetical protein EOP86_09105 [Verrucomicrobiaceae bacterium]|nr:MAG: hypothetical protein EOP86_09105 [Verrucomicrobiaceae bacterium]